MPSHIKNAIATDLAPSAIGPYSQAIKTANTVYISGQIGVDPTTSQLCNQEIELEIQQVFRNLQAIAEAAEGNLNHIVKLTIYLTDMDYFPQVNEMMAQYFEKPYPARATIAVKGLPKGARVEADAIMVIN